MKSSCLRKLIITCVLVLAICTLSLGLLSACDLLKKNKPFDNVYNATLYDRLDGYLSEEYVQGHFQYSEKSGYTLEQSFVVQTQEEFGEMFTDFPVEINFAEKLLLVHTFTTTTNACDWRLRNIEYDNGKLTIIVQRISNIFTSTKTSYVNDGIKIANPLLTPTASPPIQRTIAVIMDKVKLTYVIFDGANANVGKDYNGVYV